MFSNYRYRFLQSAFKTIKKTINHYKILYLLQLVVFLQNQVNNVADDRDLPLRETPLEELLLGQYRFIVEDISQHLHTHTDTQRNKHTLIVKHSSFEE